MKHFALSFIVLLGMMALMQSCEDNGPASHAEYPDRTSAELMEQIVEASNTGQLLLKCYVDLYYRCDGDWECYGTYPIYNDTRARADKADYVLFGEDDLIPVEHVDKYGYQHRVLYLGEYYYY